MAVNLACGLAHRGHDCWIVAISSPVEFDWVRDGLLGEMAAASVQVIEFAGTSLRSACFRGALGLVKLCRSIRPDVVHSHSDHSDLAVGLASRITSSNVARTIHSAGLWTTHWWAGLVAESAFCEDLVICISQSSQRAYAEVRRRYNLGQSRYQAFITNGIYVDGTADQFDRAAVVNMVGADPGRVLLCFAGRFVHEKGFDVLISAMEQLPTSSLDRLEVHAFGQGGELRKYITRAKRSELPIHFHAPVHRISRMFSGFDAVVMPSRCEGLGLVAIESLAAGVPVIATTAPGLDEVLPPGWPLAVSPDDPGSLSELLAEFANRRFEVQELKQQAATWMRGRFGLEKMVAAYEAAYRNFLERRTVNDANWRNR